MKKILISISVLILIALTFQAINNFALSRLEPETTELIASYPSSTENTSILIGTKTETLSPSPTSTCPPGKPYRCPPDVNVVDFICCQFGCCPSDNSKCKCTNITYPGYPTASPPPGFCPQGSYCNNTTDCKCHVCHHDQCGVDGSGNPIACGPDEFCDTWSSLSGCHCEKKCNGILSCSGQGCPGDKICMRPSVLSTCQCCDDISGTNCSPFNPPPCRDAVAPACNGACLLSEQRCINSSSGCYCNSTPCMDIDANRFDCTRAGYCDEAGKECRTGIIINDDGTETRYCYCGDPPVRCSNTTISPSIVPCNDRWCNDPTNEQCVPYTYNSTEYCTCKIKCELLDCTDASDAIACCRDYGACNEGLICIPGGPRIGGCECVVPVGGSP